MPSCVAASRLVARFAQFTLFPRFVDSQELVLLVKLAVVRAMFWKCRLFWAMFILLYFLPAYFEWENTELNAKEV